MNFSRLIKAMAVVGLLGFGGHALAGPETNTVGTVQDFEAPFTPGSFTNQLEETSWSYTVGDKSMVTNDTISAFGIWGFESAKAQYVHGDDPDFTTQLLALDTDGNDLKFAAVTATNATVFVDALVKMVAGGSGTVAGISNDVQTAIYLDNTDELNPVLKAFVTGGAATNEWVTLSGVVVNDGDWVALKIEIDYISEAINSRPLAKFIVNGTTLTDSTTLTNQFTVANRAQAFTDRHVREVAFRGTGMVDNFSVSQSEEVIAYATIVTRTVDTNRVEIAEIESKQYVIGQESVSQGFDETINGHFDLQIIELRDAETDDLIDTFEDGLAEFDVESPTFVDGKTYYLQGVYAHRQYSVEVTYEGTYAPDGPVTNYVYHGEDFVYDVSGLVTNGAIVQYEDLDDDFFEPLSPPTILVDVQRDYRVAIHSDGWNPPTYAVTYNANGADDGTVPEAQVKTHDVTLTLASNSGNLVKTGFTFAGWNTEADGLGTDYAEGANYTANAAVTLYAKWTEASAEDIEFDTGEDADANLVFTEITYADGVFTVTFTADGTVNAATVTLWVRYRETLDGADNYTEVTADVAVDEGEITGTFEIDADDLGLPESVFILGISTTDPDA